ncbi:MAG: DNA-3-methyladenine glycosylase [Coriobacteriia bacterium]|nr:DNA-3-methyladenine glycosylase [Coriobacteriia bacterium]
MTGFDPDSAHPVSQAFFDRPTAVVARELLGTVLVSRVGGVLTAGEIVETEAYLGVDDPGSHAATKGITARNRVMYGPPGHAYVYFTYGNHHMLNLVTGPEGVAGAVLVRAIRPVAGISAMEDRRPGRTGVDLTNGPGKLASALGIDLALNGVALGDVIAVYEGARVPDEVVVVGGRIGLSDGHDLPLRFCVEGERYVSKGRTGPRPRTRGSASATKGMP